MRSGLLILTYTMLCLGATAQYPGYSVLPDDRSFREKFAQASASLRTLRCDFVQEKDLSLLSEKLTSGGKFYFQKENQVRMEYQQPYPYLMIIQGNKIYTRDGQKSNSLNTKSNKLFSQINTLMLDCVQGSALSNPDFAVRIFSGKSSYLVELTTRSGELRTYFSSIVLTVDGEDFMVNRILMKEANGDHTLIHFINKQINAALPNSLFTIP